MSTPRKALYDRLPEIYHIRDREQGPPGQLEAYLDVIDEVMGAVRDNIEALYDDFFIETCDDWVIPYIADLVGSSHLKGDPWTLRADAARTIHHRRRKGTLGAVESLSHSLTGWAAHAVELRRNVAWNQHLNHQRPDAGGRPPLADHVFGDPVRHGTIALRDPAWLSFFNGPFDPFAHQLDIRPHRVGVARYNFPVLGVFLWRLQDYLVPRLVPGMREAVSIDTTDLASGIGTPAAHAVRVILHPLAEIMPLFNTHRFHADEDPPELSLPDAVPGPMPMARLTTGSDDKPGAGNPSAYLAAMADPTGGTVMPGAESVGLTLHLPEGFDKPDQWRWRGADLRYWQHGLRSPLLEDEIVVDPVLGRVLIGLDEESRAETLESELLASVTHGFSGPTGAQPIVRDNLPAQWAEETPTIVRIAHDGSESLADALGGLPGQSAPLIIEIEDSHTHDLDLSTVAGHVIEDGEPNLAMRHSLWIRAADGHRPVIRLHQPLRFRPDELEGEEAQDRLERLTVRLEGLYLSWHRGEESGTPVFPATDALIERAAVHRCEIVGCTLDPGGARQVDCEPPDERGPMRVALRQGNDFGFTESEELAAFSQVPEIVLERSITGALALDDRHALSIRDSVVDAGADLSEASPGLAIGSAGDDPDTEWGPPTTIAGVTLFGRTRVHSITGQGGLFVHRLQAHDNQSGCLKFSWFRGDGDRLPPHHACVFGDDATLSFVAQVFGEPGYAQLRLRSDARILEQGPKRDAMGAFGYLMNTHKWKNLNIRYREYMPVGIRPALIPVT